MYGFCTGHITLFIDVFISYLCNVLLHLKSLNHSCIPIAEMVRSAEYGRTRQDLACVRKNLGRGCQHAHLILSVALGSFPHADCVEFLKEDHR